MLTKGPLILILTISTGKVINTRQSKKPKWSRQIPKKEWDHNTFEALAFDLFTTISTAMETDNPTWPAEKINEYINWKNENKQKDPTAPLQLQGPYLGSLQNLSSCREYWSGNIAYDL